MAASNVVMAWSQCSIEIGAVGEEGAMGLSLASIGHIKDKSATLEASEGEKLEMKATGGKTIAEEELEGEFVLKARVIEPDDAFYTTLGLGAVNELKYDVKTHVVSGYRSVKLSPKNTGATGIEAPKCSVKFHPGWSEEDGHFADMEFRILQATADVWYTRFKKA